MQRIPLTKTTNNNQENKTFNSLKQNDFDSTLKANDINKIGNISIKLFHSNLIEQVFKKLELISINSLLASNTAASSFLNSYDNNFCSKNFSINPRLASGEDENYTRYDDDLNFLPTTKTNYSINKSFTLTRKYSSKEQQKEHDQQKRQSIKSHSSLKNLSNIESDGYKSTNSLSFSAKDAINILVNNTMSSNPFSPNKFKYRKAKSAATPYSSHKLKRIFRNHSSSSGTSPSVTIVNSSLNPIPQIVNNPTHPKANKFKSKIPLSSVMVAPIENEKKCENNFLNLASNEKSVSLVNVTSPTPVHTPIHNQVSLNKQEQLGVEANNNRHESRYIKSTRYQKLQPKSISSVIPMPTITQSFRMDSLEKENSVSSVNSISKANSISTNSKVNNKINATNTILPVNGLLTSNHAKKLSNQNLNLLKVTPSQSISASMSRSSSKRQMTYLDSTSMYQNEYSIDTNDPVTSHVYSQNVSKKMGDNVSIISSKLSLLKRTVRL